MNKILATVSIIGTFIISLLTFGYRSGRSRAKEKDDNKIIAQNKQEQKQTQHFLEDEAQDYSKNELLSELDHGKF